MDALTCVKAISPPLQDLGSKFMFEPHTFAVGGELGIESPYGFYAVGRFGALGDPSSEEVLKEGFVFEPETFRQIWEENKDIVGDIVDASQKYLDCCAEWGRTNIVDTGSAEALAAAGEKILAGVSYDHTPIVLGIRGKSFPEDAAGKAAVMAYALRELRFCHHTKALAEEGLAPLEAVMVSGGEGNAKMFQWPEPYPEVTDELRTRYQKAEEQTDAYFAKDFEVLDDSERSALTEGVQQIAQSLAG